MTLYSKSSPLIVSRGTLPKHTHTHTLSNMSAAESVPPAANKLHRSASRCRHAPINHPAASRGELIWSLTAPLLACMRLTSYQSPSHPQSTTSHSLTHFGRRPQTTTSFAERSKCCIYVTGSVLGNTDPAKQEMLGERGGATLEKCQGSASAATFVRRM